MAEARSRRGWTGVAIVLLGEVPPVVWKTNSQPGSLHCQLWKSASPVVPQTCASLWPCWIPWSGHHSCAPQLTPSCLKPGLVQLPFLKEQVRLHTTESALFSPFFAMRWNLRFTNCVFPVVNQRLLDSIVRPSLPVLNNIRIILFI